MLPSGFTYAPRRTSGQGVLGLLFLEVQVMSGYSPNAGFCGERTA